MKKLLLVFIWGLLFNSGIMAQITFERTYSGSDSYMGNSVQQTLDEGYIIAGTKESSAKGEKDVYLLKTDLNGDTLWTRSYGGEGDQKGKSVQQTSDGGYIIAGYTGGSFSSSVYLIKTDSSGDTLWTQTYGEVMMLLYRGLSVKQTSDGGFIISGTLFYYTNYTSDLCLIKTDASGEMLWTQIYGNDADSESGNSVEQTTDGGYVVGGTKKYADNTSDMYLVKTNAIGDTLWTRTYSNSSGDFGNCVEQSSDGGYIIVGYTILSGGNYFIYLVKVDTDGHVLWTQTYGTSNPFEYHIGNSIRQTSDGGYIVAGYTGYSTSDVYLIKTDNFGDTLWTRTYGTDSGDEYGNDVQLTMDDGFVITGYAVDPATSRNKVYIVKTDEQGLIVGITDNIYILNKIQLYPNPATDFVNIKSDIHINIVKIYNIAGEVIANEKANSKSYLLNTSRFKAGIYLFQIETDKGMINKRLILK